MRVPPEKAMPAMDSSAVPTGKGALPTEFGSEYCVNTHGGHQEALPPPKTEPATTDADPATNEKNKGDITRTELISGAKGRSLAKGDEHVPSSGLRGGYREGTPFIPSIIVVPI